MSQVCLFVGGPMDGERRALPSDTYGPPARFYCTTRQGGTTLPFNAYPEEVLRAARASIIHHTYRREYLNVYVHQEPR